MKKILICGSSGFIGSNILISLSKNKNCDWATLPMWGMRYKKEQTNKLKYYKKVVTVENHLQDGGFGSWLSESLTKNNNSAHTKIMSKFLDHKVIGQVGSEQYLNLKYGLK